jgi:hypothetical protein
VDAREVRRPDPLHPPWQTITVTVTKPGYIGEQLTLTAKRGGFATRRTLIASG